MIKISIDRLQIRLKSISPNIVKASVGNLGMEILRQLESLQPTIKKKGPFRIKSIDSPAISSKEPVNPIRLRQNLATGIARSIVTKINGSSEGVK